MGWFSELFVNREKENAKDIRRAIFRSRRAVGGLEKFCEEFAEKRDAAWTKAKAYLMKGQKREAENCVREYQRNEIFINNISKKIAVVNHYITNLEIAQTCGEVTSALAQLSGLVKLDVSTVHDSLEGLNSIMDDSAQIDELYGDIFKEQNRDLDHNNNTSTMDELMSALTSEAGLSVSGDIPVSETAAGVSAGDIKSENDILDRMGKMVNGKQ